MNYRLTYDFGSGSVKAALVDELYNLTGVKNAPYVTYFPQNGWAEQKPQELWDAMCRSTQELLGETHIAPEQIVGIAISHTATAVILVDECGEAITDCIMWMDSRAEREAEEINRKLGEKKYTGKNVISKLAWLLKNRPQKIQDACYMLDISAYLMHKLTGNFLYEFTAARSTCLVDMEKRCWDQKQFDLIKFPRTLVPEKIIGSIEQAGTVTAEAAAQTGLCEGIPVFGGCSDHATAILGTACVNPDDAHLYIGTSAWLAVVTSDEDVHRGRMPSPIPKQWYHFYDTDSGGTCLDSLRDLYYRDVEKEPFDRIGQDVMQLQAVADREDVLFLPFLAGASAPINNMTVRGSMLNLKRSTDRMHIARAVMEGICFNLRWMKELHEQSTASPITALKGIGGGMCSPVLVQMLADILGVPVTSMQNPRFAGNIGLALCVDLGLQRDSDFSKLSHIIRSGVTCEPQPENKERYDRLYQIYRAAYHALEPIYEQLNGNRNREGV